jgi:nitrate reductase NapD
MSGCNASPGTPATTDEVHIASLVVHASPARVAAAAEAIRALPDARVHAVSGAGKIVVTLETDSGAVMTDQIEAMRRLPGVLSAVLVYQCTDTAEAMNEEMP